MKSKVTVSRPHLDLQTGLQNSWGNAPDINYDSHIELEDGTTGINSSRKPGPNPYYVIGNDCEYETQPGRLKQDGTSWPQKIIRPKSSFQKDSKGNNFNPKGIALRYAVDVWIAGKIEKDKVFATADKFHGYMEATPAFVQPPMGTVATHPEAKAFETQVQPEPEEIDDLPF